MLFFIILIKKGYEISPYFLYILEFSPPILKESPEFTGSVLKETFQKDSHLSDNLLSVKTAILGHRGFDR